MLFWVGSAALLLRLLYFVQHSHTDFFLVPILDEKFYDVVARALMEGRDVSAVDPAFRPLLYSALLAWIYGLAEHLPGFEGHALVLVLQHLLGVATTLLVASTAARAFGRISAGAAAGALYLLAGPPLFYEGELLITTVATFLLALLSRCLLGCRPWAGGDVATEAEADHGPTTDAAPRAQWPAAGARYTRWLLPWAAAGLLLGLAAQARANVLSVALAIPLMAWLGPRLAGIPVASRRRARIGGLLACAVVLAGLLLTLATAATWQASHVGHLTLLPGAGGVNLYLGNERGADGMVPRQDRQASYGNTYRDSVQLFAEEVYREQTGDRSPRPEPGAISRFWIHRALEEVRADPSGRLRLLLRKAVLLTWYREIPNNKSFHFFADHEVRLLSLLPVGFAGLLGLAALGAVAAWQRGDRHFLGWILLTIGLYGLGIVLFFVAGRFRIPLWPLLSTLGGGGALALAQMGRLAWQAVRRNGASSTEKLLLRSRSSRVLGLGLGAVVVSISMVGWPGARIGDSHRDYFFRSLARFEKGLIEGARSDAERAVELEPSDPAARFQLGSVALAQDDLDTAFRHLSAALRLAPGEPRVANNLGVVLEKRQDTNGAYLAYRKALEL
ncbi:MAG: hypothetical protein MI919_27390, partial [Holophagales bacterium]|nr:hypothetical protein [Holophagales bacterium]